MLPVDGNSSVAAALRIMRVSVDNEFGTLANWGAHVLDGKLVSDLVNLGTHILDDGTQISDFSVALPHRCKHRGASALAQRTQWIEIDEFEAKEARGEYPLPLGPNLSKFISQTLNRTPLNPSAYSGPFPVGISRKDWISLLHVRARCLSIDQRCPELVSDSSMSSSLESYANVRAIADPLCETLFWVTIVFVDQNGVTQRARALIDSGSSMDVVSETFVNKHHFPLNTLALPKKTHGVVEGSSAPVTSSVTFPFILGEKSVADTCRFNDVHFFVMNASLPLILGKPFLHRLEKMSHPSALIVSWTDNLLGFAPLSGGLILLAADTPHSSTTSTHSHMRLSEMARSLLFVICGGQGVKVGPALLQPLSSLPSPSDFYDATCGSMADFRTKWAAKAVDSHLVVFLPLNGLPEWTCGFLQELNSGMLSFVAPKWTWHPYAKALSEESLSCVLWLPQGTADAYSALDGPGACHSPWTMVRWFKPTTEIKSNPSDLNLKNLLHVLGLNCPDSPPDTEIAEPNPTVNAAQSEPSSETSQTLDADVDKPLADRVESDDSISMCSSSSSDSGSPVSSDSDSTFRPRPKTSKSYAHLSKRKGVMSTSMRRTIASMRRYIPAPSKRKKPPWQIVDWNQLSAEAVESPEDAVLFLFQHSAGKTYVKAHSYGLQDLSPADIETLKNGAFDPAVYDEVFVDSRFSIDRTVKAFLSEQQQCELDTLLTKHNSQFNDATSWDDSSGRPKGYEMPVKLKDESSYPTRQKPRRLRADDFEELKKQIAVLLKANFIVPSNSPFGAPVLFVAKKGGQRRFAVDYRALNDMTVPDVTPLPLVDDMLQQLHGSAVFSKIDMTWMFWQLRIKESDQHKTAMITPLGHFDWKVVPFGLTNAPGHCMNVISDVLRPMLYKFAMVLLDDIIIYSKNIEEHLLHLAQVFAALEGAKFFAKRSKCEFCVSRLHYLGHVVSAEGIEAEGSKLISMRDFPSPLTVRDVRAFLGLTGYYRKMVRDYSKIAAPLSDATKGGAEGAVVLSEDQINSFNELKRAMLSAPVLRLIDPGRAFTLQVDASAFAIGGVLMQPSDDGLLHPVGYFSRKLSEAQQRYTVTARELLAITEALRFWKIELHGCVGGLTIYSDHRPLSYLRSVQPLGDMHARWLQTIESIPFTLVHKPGTSMGPADTLSRRSDLADPVTGGAAIRGQARVLPDFPDDIELLMSEGQSCASELIPKLYETESKTLSLALLPDMDLDFICQFCLPCISMPVTTRGRGRKDFDSVPPAIKPVILKTAIKPTVDGFVPDSFDLDAETTHMIADHSDFLERLKQASLNDLVWYPKAERHDTEFCFLANGLIQKVTNGRPLVYVPRPLHDEVIQRHHDPLYCGHLAAKKTYERILRGFWWPGLKSDVEKYCRSCPVCQRSKRTTQLPYGKPSPFNVPYRRFEILTMDEVSGFPTTERGNCKAWVFVDKLSKHLTVVPFGESVDAMAIARALLDRIIQYWGLPRKIVSDRDPRLAGDVYQTLCRLWNVRPNISSARSAQTDGQSESAVEAISQLLRAFVNHNASDWDLLLPSLTFAYNDSVSAATGFTPLFLLHGEHPASPIAMLARDLTSEISDGIRQTKVADFVRRIGENIARARIQLNHAREQIGKQMSSRVRFVEFMPGDLVLLHRIAAGVIGNKLGKLGPRWVGPFKVLEKRFDNAYRLDLPPVMAIEPVVNLRFLKRFYEADREDSTPAQMDVPISSITQFRITPDHDNLYHAELEIQTVPPSIFSGNWLTVKQCVSSGAFAMLSSFLASLPDLCNPANHYLGREVLDWQFRDRPFPGIVASFDPMDSKSQYEIYYEDGDSGWVSKLHLGKILSAHLPTKGRAVLHKNTKRRGRVHALLQTVSVAANRSLLLSVPSSAQIFSHARTLICHLGFDNIWYILLVEELTGQWCWPGGKVAPVDAMNPCSTAIREIREETGLSLSPLSLIRLSNEESLDGMIAQSFLHIASHRYPTKAVHDRESISTRWFKVSEVQSWIISRHPLLRFHDLGSFQNVIDAMSFASTPVYPIVPGLSHQRILVLFSGTDSVGQFFRKFLSSSVTVINIDNDSSCPNALNVDIMVWDYSKFSPGYFDFIWCSPPCTEYSRAKTRGIRNLTGADKLVSRTLEILKYLAPRFWVIENPLGLLRTRPVIRISSFVIIADYVLLPSRIFLSETYRYMVFASLVSAAVNVYPQPTLCSIEMDGTSFYFCEFGPCQRSLRFFCGSITSNTRTVAGAIDAPIFLKFGNGNVMAEDDHGPSGEGGAV